MQTQAEHLKFPDMRRWSSITYATIAYCIHHFSEPVDLHELARIAQMSRFSFCRRFQRECGVTPMRWLWEFRVIVAAHMLTHEPDHSLTHIAFHCGFASSAHFSRAFRACYRQQPRLYRQEHCISPSRLRSRPSNYLEKRKMLLRAAFSALSSANTARFKRRR